MASSARASSPLYKLKPLPLLGAQVEGVDLHTENREEVIDAIIEEVHRWIWGAGGVGVWGQLCLELGLAVWLLGNSSCRPLSPLGRVLEEAARVCCNLLVPMVRCPAPHLPAVTARLVLPNCNSCPTFNGFISWHCRHRLLLFRNQGVVSGERHVEISQWFGELESTFYKHPRSPHPDVSAPCLRLGGVFFAFIPPGLPKLLLQCSDRPEETR